MLPSAHGSIVGHVQTCVPSAKNCSFVWGIWTPSNTWFLGSTRLSIPNGISIGSAVFAQLTADSSYTLQWAPQSPKNCPFPWGDLDLHVTHYCLIPSKTEIRTASRSLEPFLYKSPQSEITLYNGPPSHFKIAPSHGWI